MGATIRDSVMFGLGKWPLREMAITAPNGHLGLELQPNAALNFEQLRNLRNRAFESVIDLCGPWAGLVLATQAQLSGRNGHSRRTDRWQHKHRYFRSEWFDVDFAHRQFPLAPQYSVIHFAPFQLDDGRLPPRFLWCVC